MLELAPPVRAVRLVLALSLSSGLSVALSVARMVRTGTRVYGFLDWNLVLAWVPLVLALAVVMIARRGHTSRLGPRLAMGALLAAWFLFFPNAPYLITDLVHLAPRENVPVVYDIVLFFSFAFSGLMTGFLSLRLVEEQVRRWWGRGVSWGVSCVTLTASGFGVYLGRFERYNSWDVVARPLVLFRRILEHLASVLESPRALIITGVFALFLVVAYVTITQVSVALRTERTR